MSKVTMKELLERSYYIVKCKDDYEQRKLMKLFDKHRITIYNSWDRNLGDYCQTKFINYKEDEYFRLYQGKIVVFDQRTYDNFIEEYDYAITIIPCDIQDYCDSYKTTSIEGLVDCSNSPDEVNDVINKILESENYYKEKCLFNIIENLINKVNYLESYITAHDSDQRQMLIERKKENDRVMRMKIQKENEFLERVYYMDNDTLREYVNKNVGGDGKNRINKVYELKRDACRHMSDYHKADMYNGFIMD